MTERFHDIDLLETLIDFNLRSFPAKHGHAVVMQLSLAGFEGGVRVITVHCTAGWAKGLAEALAEEAEAPLAPPRNQAREVS